MNVQFTATNISINADRQLTEEEQDVVVDLIGGYCMDVCDRTGGGHKTRIVGVPNIQQALIKLQGKK